MAIDFPATTGQATDGTFAHTASGITWAWDGTTWKAQGVTGSYVLPTASATGLGGVKIGTGISINTGTISSTLQSVVDSNATCTSEVFIQNKLYFSNNFAALADLQAVSASTYHGMFAHVHATGHGYFAHAGGWQQLIDTASSIGELGDVDLSSAPTDGQVLKWVAASSNWVAGTVSGGGSSYANSDVDTHLNTSTASTNDVLGWNGSDYFWTAQTGGGASLTVQDEGSTLATAADTLDFVGAGVTVTGTLGTKTITISGGGGGGALQSRQTFNAATNSIADGAAGNITITAYKTYSLLKIQTSAAAWVTLYTDQASRTSDANRSEATDPLPGSGVIAEVITTAAATQIITPATIGWNNESTPVASVYAKVVNKSGGAAAITVTITVVQLEG